MRGLITFISKIIKVAIAALMGAGFILAGLLGAIDNYKKTLGESSSEIIYFFLGLVGPILAAGLGIIFISQVYAVWKDE